MEQALGAQLSAISSRRESGFQCIDSLLTAECRLLKAGFARIGSSLLGSDSCVFGWTLPRLARNRSIIQGTETRDRPFRKRGRPRGASPGPVSVGVPRLRLFRRRRVWRPALRFLRRNAAVGYKLILFRGWVRGYHGGSPEGSTCQLTMDRETFERLYHAHYRATVARFRRRGCVVEDAEDLAQQVFQNVWKGRASLEDPSRPEVWVRAIERNVWKNHCRDRHAAKRDAPEVAFDETLGNPDEGGDHGLTQLLVKESDQALARAIGSLPEKAGQVFVMFYLHQLKGAQIAWRLHLSPNTVKTHLFHARKRLRHLLSDEEGP